MYTGAGVVVRRRLQSTACRAADLDGVAVDSGAAVAAATVAAYTDGDDAVAVAGVYDDVGAGDACAYAVTAV